MKQTSVKIEAAINELRTAYKIIRRVWRVQRKITDLEQWSLYDWAYQVVLEDLDHHVKELVSELDDDQESK